MTNTNTTTTAPAKKYRYGWTFVDGKGNQIAPFHSTCIKAHDWAFRNGDEKIVRAYRRHTIHLTRIRETINPASNPPAPNRPAFRGVVA
jgi:hypothetical protein